MPHMPHLKPALQPGPTADESVRLHNAEVITHFRDETLKHSFVNETLKTFGGTFGDLLNVCLGRGGGVKDGSLGVAFAAVSYLVAQRVGLGRRGLTNI